MFYFLNLYSYREYSRKKTNVFNSFNSLNSFNSTPYYSSPHLLTTLLLISSFPIGFNSFNFFNSFNSSLLPQVELEFFLYTYLNIWGRLFVDTPLDMVVTILVYAVSHHPLSSRFGTKQ